MRREAHAVHLLACSPVNSETSPPTPSSSGVGAMANITVGVRTEACMARRRQREEACGTNHVVRQRQAAAEAATARHPDFYLLSSHKDPVPPPGHQATAEGLLVKGVDVVVVWGQVAPVDKKLYY